MSWWVRGVYAEAYVCEDALSLMASLRANAVRGHNERQPISSAHCASMPGGLHSRDALVHVHNICCSSWGDGGPIQGETEVSTRQLMRMAMHFKWRKCSTVTQLRGHSERLPICEVYTVFRPQVLCSRDAPLQVGKTVWLRNCSSWRDSGPARDGKLGRFSRRNLNPAWLHFLGLQSSDWDTS